MLRPISYVNIWKDKPILKWWYFNLFVLFGVQARRLSAQITLQLFSCLNVCWKTEPSITSTYTSITRAAQVYWTTTTWWISTSTSTTSVEQRSRWVEHAVFVHFYWGAFKFKILQNIVQPCFFSYKQTASKTQEYMERDLFHKD